MLASISSFAKQSNFEVLICLRDNSSKKIAQLSSDCKQFTLGSAVDALSTCKSTIASLTSQVESLKVLADMLNDQRSKLTDTASTKASSAESNKCFADSCDGKSLAGEVAISAPVCSFADYNQESTTAACKSFQSTPELNFMNLPFAELNRCDDKMTHDHENSEPIRNSSLDYAVIPPLRKVMTQMHDDDNVMCMRGPETPRSATQLEAIHEEDLESNEHSIKESKYLCHMRCSRDPIFSTSMTKGRLGFAQKHLFKSGLAPAPESDRDVSERESDDAQSCHEADLTDPVSNQPVSEGQLGDGYTVDSYMPEDEDDIDFMFLACADWEKAAEEERNAAAQDMKSDQENDKSFEESSTNQLKRVSKNARKLGELEAAAELSQAVKPTGSCSSFASYLACAEADPKSVDVYDQAN